MCLRKVRTVGRQAPPSIRRNLASPAGIRCSPRSHPTGAAAGLSVHGSSMWRTDLRICFDRPGSYLGQGLPRLRLWAATTPRGGTLRLVTRRASLKGKGAVVGLDGAFGRPPDQRLSAQTDAAAMGARPPYRGRPHSATVGGTPA